MLVFFPHACGGDAGAPIGIRFHRDVGQRHLDQRAQNAPQLVHLDKLTINIEWSYQMEEC